jgi:hypothetical protein
VSAHAVGTTVCWSVVAITELFGRNIVDLGKGGRWRENEGDLVDKTDDMIASRGNCEQ